jgi:hypothetical protein
MTAEVQTSTTLTRVREAQIALDKAQAAMESVHSGLSALETVAGKAESARRHPVRTVMLALLGATIAFGVMVVFKSMAD